MTCVKEMLSRLPLLPYSYSVMGITLFLVGWWSGNAQRSSAIVLAAQAVGVITLAYTALAILSHKFSEDRDAA